MCKNIEIIILIILNLNKIELEKMQSGNGFMEEDIQNGDSSSRSFQDIEQIPDNQQELLAEFERRRRVRKPIYK